MNSQRVESKKKEVLESTTFGKRVAEEEEQQLKLYFVETKQWKKIYSGEIDILYGSKGSGKSAIYSLLLKRADELSKQNIILIPAENLQGFPVFQELATNPPTREDEFRRLWKIYFLTLIVSHFRSSKLKNKKASRIISILEDAGLITQDDSLSGKLRSALRYVRNIKVESLETANLKVDPLTGNPKLAIGKITFGDPTPSQLKRGFISADTLIKTADEVLLEAGKSIWLVLDRLDVAFAYSDELEGNALRALFGVYQDIKQLARSVSLKIFLRSDIWRRITDKRVPEASHITRYDTLTWDSNSLMELVISRLLHNEAIREFYKVDVRGAESILNNSEARKAFFYRIFPQRTGGKKSGELFTWILNNTRDALDITSPRELIHLFNETRDIQIKLFDELSYELPGERLFSFDSLKKALPIVSRARYELTLCAENPHLKELLQWLEGRKSTQTVDTLSKVWGIGPEDVYREADKLMEAGVFERKGTRDNPIYHIAPIYLDALNIRQRAKKLGEYISNIPEAILHRLSDPDVSRRATALLELASGGGEEAFLSICLGFDDEAKEVRNSAARALYKFPADTTEKVADNFTRAIRESPPPRRRQIGAAIASSGLADDLIGNLTGESRDITYLAFSILFLMAKCGEIAPLIRAIESHPDNEVRLAIVKLLTLSGQYEILPDLRRLAVRGSLPVEIRSAVMEAIYQISSQQVISAQTPPQEEM